MSSSTLMLLVEPDEDNLPNLPEEPPANSNSATVAIATYNFTKYQHEVQQHQRKVKEYAEKNAKVLGILSLSLSFSI